MTSELSKYLNEQLGVFLNVKQQKWRELKHIKKEFLNKTLYCIMKNFIKNLCYLGFWKFLTFSFKFFSFSFRNSNINIRLRKAKAFGFGRILFFFTRAHCSVFLFFKFTNRTDYSCNLWAVFTKWSECLYLHV